jgi:hypothetical protein
MSIMSAVKEAGVGSISNYFGARFPLQASTRPTR